MDPFIAEIRILPYSFAPRGWATCDGQLMAISQNTALFALLGTYYGGDGKSTFALPNLQASVPIFWGQGSGLSERFLGESGGAQNLTLLTAEMPVHTHTLSAFGLDPAELFDPTNRSLGKSVNGSLYQTNVANVTNLSFQATSIAGASQPHNNMQPYLVVQFCIALQGIFPARQ